MIRRKNRHRFFRVLYRLLPHLCLAISVMMLVFYVIDHFNHAMHFIGNDIFNALLLIYSILVLILSVFMIAINRRRR